MIPSSDRHPGWIDGGAGKWCRQARSEATRRKIIDSAVDLINEIGYPAAGLGDIIERAELTKGALYYHFDSKEALADRDHRRGLGKPARRLPRGGPVELPRDGETSSTGASS